MIPLRRLLACVVVLAVHRANAQAFEGTVTIRHTVMTPDGKSAAGGMVMDIKGDRSATATTLLGQEAHIVTDTKTGMRTIWLPKPPSVQFPPQLSAAGAVNGLMFISPLKRAVTTMPKPSAATPMVGLKKLATSETIAGLKCDDYDVTGIQGPPTRLCATTVLGRFNFPTPPEGAGSGGPTPSWVSAFDDGRLFPLKVWTLDGKSTLEVVSVRRHAVYDSVFVVPPGYLDMVKYQQAHPRGGRGL